MSIDYFVHVEVRWGGTGLHLFRNVPVHSKTNAQFVDNRFSGNKWFMGLIISYVRSFLSERVGSMIMMIVPVI
jgi:hypothetical protein